MTNVFRIAERIAAVIGAAADSEAALEFMRDPRTARAIAEVANGTPKQHEPVWALDKRSSGSQGAFRISEGESEQAFSRVYLFCTKTGWRSIPVGAFPRAPSGDVIASLDASMGRTGLAGLSRKVSYQCVPGIHRAEARARVLRKLDESPTTRFYALIALAAIADDEHAPVWLGCLSPWERMRVQIVRSGAVLALPAPKTQRGSRANLASPLEQLRRDISAASPLSSILSRAAALQVLVLCAVACYGAEALGCVFAALVVGSKRSLLYATAAAIPRALIGSLPVEVRAMLVPKEDVRCAAHGLLSLLAASGLVPSPIGALGITAVQAALMCRPVPIKLASAEAAEAAKAKGPGGPTESIGPAGPTESIKSIGPAESIKSIGYAAPCRLIAVACQFAATSVLLFRTEIRSVAVPAAAGDPPRPDWSRGDWIRHASRDPNVSAPWASAMGAYLENVESALSARLSIETLGTYLPLSGLTAAVHPLLLRLAICALISASGAWRGDVSLPYGTMLAFIAWYNPVLAEALRFCVKL